MAYQALGLGTTIGDGTGDTIRAGGDKINDNFVEIYTLLGTGTALTSGISATATVVTLAGPSISGVASFADGSNTAPSITNTGDTNTGIYFGAADTVNITTGGTKRIEIDSSGLDVTGAITATGNVGVGTSSPARNLTVNGSIQIASGGVIEAGTTTLNTYIAGVEGASGRWAFATNGGERMRIDSSGNVGIGTTAPSSMLEISGAGDDTNVIVMSQGGNYKNSIQNSHSGVASNARISFFVHDSSTTQANVMSLLGNGNVGIGTTTPSQKLEVAGNIAIANAGNIGSAGDADAIAIASNGVVTFSQIPVLPANSILIDNLVDNSITEAKMANDAISSAELKTLSTLLIKNSSGTTLATFHTAGA
jgi:hypothetical protein